MVVIRAPSGATRPRPFLITLCVWFLEHTLLFAAVTAWHALPASVPTIPGPRPMQPLWAQPGPGSAAFLSCTLPLQATWYPTSGCLPVCPNYPRLVGCPRTKVSSSFRFHCRVQCLARR